MPLLTNQSAALKKATRPSCLHPQEARLLLTGPWMELHLPCQGQTWVLWAPLKATSELTTG